MEENRLKGQRQDLRQRHVDGHMKIFTSHVIAYQKASTTEEALNNLVDRMIQPIDVSQSLSSATLCLALWAHERSSRSGRDGVA